MLHMWAHVCVRVYIGVYCKTYVAYYCVCYKIDMTHCTGAAEVGLYLIIWKHMQVIAAALLTQRKVAMQLYIDSHKNATLLISRFCKLLFYGSFSPRFVFTSFRVQSADLGRALPRPSQLARQELTNSPGTTTAQNAVMFLDLSSEIRDCQLEGGIKTRSRALLRAPRPGCDPRLRTCLTRLLCPQPPAPVLLAAPPGSCHSQARGQAPGQVLGRSALTALVYTAACSSGDMGVSASRTRGVPGAGMVPVCTPGPHAPACRLAGSSHCLACTVDVDVSIL